MRAAIIGMGVIGRAQAEMFGELVEATYDPAWDASYPRRVIGSCDFAVICVGTPMSEDGSADLGGVEAAIRELPSVMPVLLRSTVPPGMTDRLLHGRRYYCHAPEFLGENVRHSWQRSADVPYMLLGGELEARSFFLPVLRKVFPGSIHECSALESEMAKYVANLYWATRVTFVNEMALICETFGVDYERVREAWLSDPRMTSVYTRRAGYPPGFGGRCWPKDLAALIAAAQDAGYDAAFLMDVERANWRFGGDEEES